MQQNETHKERLARRKAEEHNWWLSQHALKTFNWLGGRWSDVDLRELRFENFDEKRQQLAFTTAQSFVDMLEGTFILHGPYGIGKTHLLASILNALLEKEVTCKFCTAPSLFAAIQDRMNHHEDYNELIGQAIRTPLLVIDDIDKSRWSEFKEEIYFDIIDGRVKRKLPLALSTNKLEDLGSYVGGACLSRLSVGQIAIKMVGSDYRKERQ